MYYKSRTISSSCTKSTTRPQHSRDAQTHAHHAKNPAVIDCASCSTLSKAFARYLVYFSVTDIDSVEIFTKKDAVLVRIGSIFVRKSDTSSFKNKELANDAVTDTFLSFLTIHTVQTISSAFVSSFIKLGDIVIEKYL